MPVAGLSLGALLLFPAWGSIELRGVEGLEGTLQRLGPADGSSLGWWTQWWGAWAADYSLGSQRHRVRGLCTLQRWKAALDLPEARPLGWNGLVEGSWGWAGVVKGLVKAAHRRGGGEKKID